MQLSEQFPFSFQALSKHIKILEQANVVRKRVEGKYRILSLNKEALKVSLTWVSYYSDFWNQSFDQLDDLINNNNTFGSSE